MCYRVLVLHLKRYHFSNMFTSSRKISRDVLIPRFLTLAEHSTEHTYPAYNIDIARRNRCVRVASRAPCDRSLENCYKYRALRLNIIVLRLKLASRNVRG